MKKTTFDFKIDPAAGQNEAGNVAADANGGGNAPQEPLPTGPELQEFQGI